MQGFPFSQQRDEYRDEILKLIERKVKAGGASTVEEGKPARAPREPIDIMPLLRQSLERTASRRVAAAEPKRAKAQTARKKRA